MILEYLNSHLILRTTKQLHAVIITSSLSHDLYLAVKLLRSYDCNGDIASARRLFDGTPQRNIFLWNSMIRAYARDHDLQNAFPLFSTILGSETKPDGHTFASLFRACAEVFDVSGAKVLHCRAISFGLQSNSITSSALVNAYSKLGLPDDAGFVFDGIPHPDLVLWNSMISGYGYGGLWWKAVETFHRMRTSGLMPDGYGFVGLLSGFRNSDLLLLGRGVHGLCIKCASDSSEHLRSALLSMYCRCGSVDSAYRVFNYLAEPDLVTWSSIIVGLSHAGESEEALTLFCELTFSGKQPDHILVASTLSTCASVAAVRPGKEIHCFAFRYGFHSDIVVSCTLIDMYIKCGLIHLGLQIFDLMPERTLTAYNIVISGLGSHGFAQRAIRFFNEMLFEGLKPDRCTFSALLCACCHSALVEEGCTFFRRMQDDFGIVAQTEHYVYIVRLLGMVGKLQEAYELIKRMPIIPETGVWGAMLWGCSINNNIELGKVVANRLHEMEPLNTAYKVILSNSFASEKKWDSVELVRSEITGKGIGKLPGYSWISDGHLSCRRLEART